MASSWMIAPPNYVLLRMSVAAFFLSLIGLHDQKNRWMKLRSFITMILSSLLSIILLITVLLTILFSSLDTKAHIKQVHSPDGNYTIDFYKWDQGTTGIIGELDGPLWFKKRIFFEKRVEDVNVEWMSDGIVSINHHVLDLAKGEMYGYE